MTLLSTGRWTFLGTVFGKSGAARIVAVVVVLGGVLRGNAAAMESRFGERRQFAVSAERLMAYIHVRTTESFMGQTGVTSSDTFTLLGNPVGLAGSGYGWPRIGLDGFVAQNLSLGAALAFFHLSREEGQEAVSCSRRVLVTLRPYPTASRFGEDSASRTSA